MTAGTSLLAWPALAAAGAGARLHALAGPQLIVLLVVAAGIYWLQRRAYRKAKEITERREQADREAARRAREPDPGPGPDQGDATRRQDPGPDQGDATRRQDPGAGQ